MPTLDELRAFLAQRRVTYDEQDLQYGATQLRCETGEVLCHYPKRGNVVIQGRTETELAQAVAAWTETGMSPSTETGDSARNPGPNKNVFIVYGHDTDARNSLELMLRRMGLNPIILENLPAAGDTIIEKLESYLGEHSNVGFACVLVTPDDEGYPKGREEEKRYRARQNVVLELGMVLARLGRKRVAILYKESVEKPSDIDGLLYIGFAERVEEVKNELFRELRSAGYQPDTSAL